MGNNLSSEFEPDLSGVVLSPMDRDANLMLLGIWCGVLYVFAMIMSTCLLVDRWRGPLDKNPTGPSSVVQAVVLSTVWPVVVGYVMVSRR